MIEFASITTLDSSDAGLVSNHIGSSYQYASGSHSDDTSQIGAGAQGSTHEASYTFNKTGATFTESFSQTISFVFAGSTITESNSFSHKYESYTGSNFTSFYDTYQDPGTYRESSSSSGSLLEIASIYSTTTSLSLELIVGGGSQTTDITSTWTDNTTSSTTITVPPYFFYDTVILFQKLDFDSQIIALFPTIQDTGTTLSYPTASGYLEDLCTSTSNNTTLFFTDYRRSSSWKRDSASTSAQSVTIVVPPNFESGIDFSADDSTIEATGTSEFKNVNNIRLGGGSWTDDTFTYELLIAGSSTTTSSSDSSTSVQTFTNPISVSSLFSVLTSTTVISISLRDQAARDTERGDTFTNSSTTYTDFIASRFTESQTSYGLVTSENGSFTSLTGESWTSTSLHMAGLISQTQDSSFYHTYFIPVGGSGLAGFNVAADVSYFHGLTAHQLANTNTNDTGQTFPWADYMIFRTDLSMIFSTGQSSVRVDGKTVFATSWKASVEFPEAAGGVSAMLTTDAVLIGFVYLLRTDFDGGFLAGDGQFLSGSGAEANLQITITDTDFSDPAVRGQSGLFEIGLINASATDQYSQIIQAFQRPAGGRQPIEGRITRAARTGSFLSYGVDGGGNTESGSTVRSEIEAASFETSSLVIERLDPVWTANFNSGSHYVVTNYIRVEVVDEAMSTRFQGANPGIL